jgi:hypothetical protein
MSKAAAIECLRLLRSMQDMRLRFNAQLERLQRARKGEHVPAPVNVQVSSDQ